MHEVVKNGKNVFGRAKRGTDKTKHPKMRKKENKRLPQTVKYTELNKTMKKKERARATRKEFVIKILKQKEDPKKRIDMDTERK